MNHARRLFCVLLFAPGLFATGCLFPYAYPKLEYVPPAKPGPNTTDVHAFRVDVTAHQADMGEEGIITLTEIQPRADGSFPAQTRLSLESGYYVFGVALNYNVGRLHTTRVRLYRPGYQLVEIPAGGSANDVAWTAAPDWAAQEKAIDALLSRPAVSASAALYVQRTGLFWSTDNQPRQLPDVTISPQMQQAFGYVASEYERVAKLAPTEADATRLREKAKRLLEVKPALVP